MKSSLANISIHNGIYKALKHCTFDVLISIIYSIHTEALDTGYLYVARGRFLYRLTYLVVLIISISSHSLRVSPLQVAQGRCFFLLTSYLSCGACNMALFHPPSTVKARTRHTLGSCFLFAFLLHKLCIRATLILDKKVGF